MTQSKRQSLLTACAFAKVFIEFADAELRGASSENREEAALNLSFALRDLAQPDYETFTAQTAEDVRLVLEEFEKECATWG